jgi:SPASM domain peptide maturase of grasp-with-spasm system
MKGWTVSAILQAHPGQEAVVRSYFSQLEQEEYGAFFSDTATLPDMDLRWESPSRVTNAIIDVGGTSDHNFLSLFQQLDQLLCQAVQVRCFVPLSLERIEFIIAAAEGRMLRSIELLLRYTPELTPERLELLASSHCLISSIVVHSAPESRLVNTDEKQAIVLAYYAGCLDSPDCCGVVDPAYFSLQLAHFCESRTHNTCLNRKVSICADGEIRNCPSMARGFGNAGLVTIASAIASDGFTQLWSVTKDQVEICRDCEFRYVCTDCRAHLSDPGNPLSKPAKCAYDPYTATWSGRQEVQSGVAPQAFCVEVV